MEEWIISLMRQFGYFGVFFLIFVENLFPPIPSEVILAFGGFATTVPEYGMNALGVILAATLGSVLGAVVLYWIGYKFNVEVIEKFIEKWGYILRLKVEDIEKADKWFEKRGYLAVFICRMIPVLRSLISVPAVMAKMTFKYFLLYTVIGTLIWNILLVYAGAALGANWHTIVTLLGTYQDLTFAVFAIIAIIVIYLFIKRLRSKPSKA
jgi:membrane protein DedA with SNARE-associated domain